MKFGFAVVPDASIAETVQLAQLGEELGFDTAWVADQTFYRDPFVVLSACAHATRRIHLGLGATNPYTRHPVQIARAAAALNELSAGRFTLAIGAGNRKELLQPLGWDQTESGPRCREAAMVIKHLLLGEEVRHHSDTLIADPVRLLMPAQPALPVYVAGRGPYVLRSAGEVADGVIIGGLISPDGLAYALATVHDGLSLRPKRPDEFAVVSWVSCELTEDRREAIKRLQPNVAHIIGGAPVAVLRTIGLSEDRITAFKDAYAVGGPLGAAPLVTADDIDRLTLVGTADECRARIGRLEQIGVTQLGLLLNQPTLAKRRDFLRQFATQVIGR